MGAGTAQTSRGSLKVGDLKLLTWEAASAWRG